jgi:hypothetical protein
LGERDAVALGHVSVGGGTRHDNLEAALDRECLHTGVDCASLPKRTFVRGPKGATV